MASQSGASEPFRSTWDAAVVPSSVPDPSSRAYGHRQARAGGPSRLRPGPRSPRRHGPSRVLRGSSPLFARCRLPTDQIRGRRIAGERPSARPAARRRGRVQLAARHAARDRHGPRPPRRLQRDRRAAGPRPVDAALERDPARILAVPRRGARARGSIRPAWDPAGCRAGYRRCRPGTARPAPGRGTAAARRWISMMSRMLGLLADDRLERLVEVDPAVGAPLDFDLGPGQLQGRRGLGLIEQDLPEVPVDDGAVARRSAGPSLIAEDAPDRSAWGRTTRRGRPRPPASRGAGSARPGP